MIVDQNYKSIDKSSRNRQTVVTGKSVHLVKRDLTKDLSRAYVSCIFQSKDGCIYVWERAFRQSKEEGPCLPVFGVPFPER